MHEWAIALAAIISIASYVAERFEKKIERHHSTLVTLNAGILVSVAVLELLPISLSSYFGPLLLLAGFCVFYALEDYICHTVKPKHIRYEITELHFAGFFLVSFLFGMALFESSLISSGLALFLFLPFLIRKVSVSLYAIHLTERIRLPFSKEALALSTLLGALAAAALPPALLSLAFSFLTGALLFLVGRDLVHPSRKDSPLAFFFGVLITLASYVFLL